MSLAGVYITLVAIKIIANLITQSIKITVNLSSMQRLRQMRWLEW